MIFRITLLKYQFLAEPFSRFLLQDYRRKKIEIRCFPCVICIAYDAEHMERIIRCFGHAI